MKQSVLIVGAGGQLGQELLRTANPDAECVSLTRADLDIANAGEVAQKLAQLEPGLVINAAAYTAVDKAESEPELAHLANAQGPATLAAVCQQQGARLLHVSTDFVFSGEASHPYATDAVTAPLGEYGRSKLAGEQAVQTAMPEALVMRTGWVYSRFGGNFVNTMLRLMAQREELSVVADQVGTPTWANGLARALWAAAEQPSACGIYHWSDAGVCSWYDFAVAIYEEACELGLLERLVSIHPIPASDYPTPAKRPAYSVLDKTSSWRDFALEPIHWRVQLRNMLRDKKEHIHE